MGLQSVIEIFIGGNRILSFKRFSLHQEIDAHHSLQLHCRMDTLESNLDDLAGTTKNFLGETLTLQVSSLTELAGYSSLEFKGVVTGINSLKAHNHKGGDVTVITASSGTILADDGPHYDSHNDMGLNDILERTFAKYTQNNLETSFDAQFSNLLHYSVQNKESAWRYASRLAAQYGEWFYYDGKKLIFGKPKDDEDVKLTYGVDLQNFSLKLQPQPNKFNYFTNDYLLDEDHSKNTSEVPAAGGYNGFVSKKADLLFANDTRVFVNTVNDEQVKSSMDHQVKMHKKMVDQQQVLLTGASDNPSVSLGKIVKVQGKNEHYGRYRVTSIHHTAGENGQYENRFEAVSTELDVYPNTNLHYISRSETQTAVVTENADPNGMGRIKVQFSWQKLSGVSTPWLRIVSPHTGGDKGFHFIPEVGEEVLIGFEGGNAERPYVLGSLYHGNHKPKSWNTAQNDVKAIRTRSGHTFELNDGEGAEFITITDKNGNIIKIDTANNNITISALENMTLNAKNMQVNVEENLDVNVGKNKTEFIGEDSFINATNEEKQVTQEIKVLSSTYKQEAQEIKTDASGEIKTNAGGKITIASAETIEYGE